MSMTIEKDCYILDYGVNTVRIKTDFIALDPYETKGNLIMMSLVDAPAKLDKMKADYRKNSLTTLFLMSSKTETNLLTEYPYRNEFYSNCIDLKGVDYRIEKKKKGNLSHMIITQNNNSPYIFKFNDEVSINEIIMNKLINIEFIPCNLELVQEALLKEPRMLKPMIIFTDNKNLMNIEIYKFDKELFVKTINKIAEDKGQISDPIFNQFVGDFAGYINYFKPDILKNLESKILEFYNPYDVPKYVTQYPYPLPNGDMRVLLNRISQKFYNMDIQDLKYEQSVKVYETYKLMDSQGKIKRDENFNPKWSRQYEVLAAGMKMLESERFLFLSLIMGAGKSYISLKTNKYAMKHTLKKKNHTTFLLCPQSTITQWIGEIENLEKGLGHSKKDYDVIVIKQTEDLMKFYNEHSHFYKGTIRFNQKSIKKPTYILCGKETFKLSQTRRPAFNITLDKNKNYKLTCPNCGRILSYEKTIKGKKIIVDMDINDFFNKGKKKLFNSNNNTCKHCNEILKDYNDFLEEQKENSEFNENVERLTYAGNFIPTNNLLWTYDYQGDNSIRNKMFNMLESKPLNIDYSNYKTLDELKGDLNEFRIIKEGIIKDYGLWNKNNKKSTSKKISVIEFLKKKHFKFDSAIIDEAHEGNNSSSLIGTAQRLLFRFSKKIILLSGTANNGYASSLHNLLMASMPKKLIDDGTFDKRRFIEKYGIMKGILKVDEHGKISGKQELPKSAFKEVEGINPVVFAKFLAKNFIMVNTLESMDLPMPNLIEKYVPIYVDENVDNNYHRFVSDVASINPYIAAIYNGNVFQNYINNPYNWGPVEVSNNGEPVQIQPFKIDRNKMPYLEKDYQVLEIIQKEKSEGRKCFLFTNFAEGGKYIKEEIVDNKPKPIKITINDRLAELFKENGIKYTVLQSNTTSVVNRKNWIEERKDDYDVFICQPQLVNVGLNLVFCPTYIVYMPFYKYDIISQATRRGYRANSTEENRIYHLYYKSTCEETIIDRYQRKLAEAKAIEGEFFVNIESNKDIRTLSKLSNDIVKN